jgi:hypothetical protein
MTAGAILDAADLCLALCWPAMTGAGSLSARPLPAGSAASSGQTGAALECKSGGNQRCAD